MNDDDLIQVRRGDVNALLDDIRWSGKRSGLSADGEQRIVEALNGPASPGVPEPLEADDDDLARWLLRTVGTASSVRSAMRAVEQLVAEAVGREPSMPLTRLREWTGIDGGTPPKEDTQ